MLDTLSTRRAERVRAELGRQERSVRWLARQLATNEAWVRRRLGLQLRIRESDAVRLCDALGMPYAQLWVVVDLPLGAKEVGTVDSEVA